MLCSASVSTSAQQPRLTARPFKHVSIRRPCEIRCAQSPSDAAGAVSRRSLLQTSLWLAATATTDGTRLIAFPAATLAAETFKTLSDPILAYEFQYPVSTASGKALHMITVRRPEKYSSAPPLTADARQRIVSELLDAENLVSVSLSVGPASGVLKGAEPASWKPKDVAQTVLIDRSTSRLSSGQRTTMNDVERVEAQDREGTQFWVYEHLSQGSPTVKVQERETYRHALAATTVRPSQTGTPYLYTLNLVCPQYLWADLEPAFEQAVQTFKLLPPTSDFIDPDQNPWLFF